MARAYSLDLRERVVVAVADGQPCRAVVSFVSGERGERDEVIAAGARHWRPGSLTCQGKRPYPLEGKRDWLLGQLSQTPDLTLHALLDTLRDRGVAVCHCARPCRMATGGR